MNIKIENITKKEAWLSNQYNFCFKCVGTGKGFIKICKDHETEFKERLNLI